MGGTHEAEGVVRFRCFGGGGGLLLLRLHLLLLVIILLMLPSRREGKRSEGGTEGRTKLLTSNIYVTYMYCISERVSNLAVVNKYLTPSRTNSEILITNLTIVTRQDELLKGT